MSRIRLSLSPWLLILCACLLACSPGAQTTRVPTQTAATVTLQPQATVTAQPPAPPSTATALPSARVQGTGSDGLSLRPAPGSSDRLTVLAEGASVALTGEEQSSGGRIWKQIRTPDDRVGWVAADFVAGPGAPAAPPPTSLTQPPSLPQSTSTPVTTQRSSFAAIATPTTRPATAVPPTARAPAVAPPTVRAGATLVYPGNGGGPTRCVDGSISNSSGRGTCSGHGGIAR